MSMEFNVGMEGSEDMSGERCKEKVVRSMDCRSWWGQRWLGLKY